MLTAVSNAVGATYNLKMRRVVGAWLIAVTALLANVVAAGAATTSVAPPGNGAISEYSETIPGPGGNHPTQPPPSGTSGGGGHQVLPPEIRRELGRSGIDGANAAAVAEVTAPEGPRSRAGGGRSSGGRGQGGAASGQSTGQRATPSSGPLAGQAAATLGGAGGMGIALPIILAGALAAAVATGVARRRRTAGDQELDEPPG
jgi:hypothetical protein